jgi:hypothetical protein
VSVPASAGAANGAVLPVKEIVVATPNVKTVIFLFGAIQKKKNQTDNISQTSNVNAMERGTEYIYT